MAKLLKTNLDAELRVTLELTEKEIRALDGLFGYGVESFLKVFYEKMGATYLRPHADGIHSLHETIKVAVAGPLAAIDKARASVKEILK